MAKWRIKPYPLRRRGFKPVVMFEVIAPSGRTSAILFASVARAMEFVCRAEHYRRHGDIRRSDFPVTIK